MNEKDKLIESTQKLLIEEIENTLIYKIIFPDGEEFDKKYNDLRMAQEDAEKLNAKNVKSQYKDNSINELFKVFIRENYFNKSDYLKYEDGIISFKDNFGWHQINRQNEYYKLSINIPPYILGKYVDPYSAETINTFLIIDTQDGSIYEYEDTYNYYTLKEIKEELQKVLNGIYGEKLYPPYYFNPLNY